MKPVKVWLTVFDNGFGLVIISQEVVEGRVVEEKKEKLVFRTKEELMTKLQEIL